ncbi:DUF1801 domain-containing protein [Pelagibacterium halotolerans]|uniref:DUF1801 domain-containing protein n=1 Tax=Pelagibacterium halotolerans TaxID=531813 RepID=UPI00384D427A
MSQRDPEVARFLNTVEPAQKRADCESLIALMEKHTGKPARLVPGNMIGFGRVKYRYPSGHEGETFLTGFAPRKSALTLYVLWYQPEDDELLGKLGKHKRGKGCLYINKLSDVDMDVLEQIIHRAATDLDGRHIVAHLEE